MGRNLEHLQQAIECFSTSDLLALSDSMHDKGKLYPRILITCPHLGGGVFFHASLCDPNTDEEVVRVLQIEAVAETEH